MDSKGPFVLIGPTGWQIIGLALLMALGWWLIGRAGKNRPPSTLGLFLRALAWQLLPALATWREQARAYAVKRFDDTMSSESTEPLEPEPEPEPLRSFVEPHMNHVEPSSPGSLNPAELLLNADEIAALGRMIEHNKTAVKPSKSSTIQAGFGVSRGGSSLYQRASLIYDALFGVPEPAVPSKFRSNPEIEEWRRRMKLPVNH